MNTEPAVSKAQLYSRLDAVSTIDARKFRRRLAKAKAPQALVAIAGDISRAENKLTRIATHLPDITYPENLPVAARKDDILNAISENQVVIIAGETGSGKTTQIPKMCLELGRGLKGMIGHTQPRRLAARTVAERIAEELGQPMGESVGYAIRFDDRVSATTAVKLMTDGILLAEMQRDRYLNAYDTIIIDEAHERSLNIDFLLGYLKNLLPKRPDLKVIITSATIDPERFAEHFASSDGTPAPIIEVSGRTYPVEVRYRPLQFEAAGKLVDQDPLDGLCDAVEELMAEGKGDILCFFAGERDIRDAMDAIAARKLKNVDILPLFGRLSNAEQHRVFGPHSRRRIVLATNIAETSLTVPGIHYVVDTGLARISRYSNRTKVQRLPIEPISQASANQRSGRCGRVADGIAIRLYSEEDFESRPEFTDPEILRTNLASVILRMAALHLGDIAEFPFIQAPEHRSIRDGLLLLHELGALEENHDAEGDITLTPVGRELSQIPVDPRLARMLIEAHTNGCLEEATVVVAALTVQDVRERPLEHAAQADQQHARFKDKTSDFLSYLKLWSYLSELSGELSGNAFRRRLKQEYLHYLRVREWQDLVRQLRQVTRDLGWRNTESAPLNEDALHQSLLAGLLSHIGLREGDSKEFLGARNTRFMIFPGSGLAKRPPQFVMAAELVETSRLWGRDAATIDPMWVEKQAAHLLKNQYSEPHWSRKRGAAMVYQRSTLFGVPIVVDKLVPYHRVDPEAARDLFIRHALVDADWDSHHKFFFSNKKKLEEAGELEAKARRRDIVVDEDTLFDFYDSRLPSSITTARHFDRWWKKAYRDDPTQLDFDPARLLTDAAEDISEQQFPDAWRQGSLEFELTYQFDPTAPLDGVTMRIPVPLLASVNTSGTEWLVPGLRLELVTELIRTLPKALRRTVVPAPDFAERALPLLVPFGDSLYKQLADILRSLGASGINASDFSPSRLPAHLRMNFAAIDRRSKIIDSDKDLHALQQRSSEKIQSSVAQSVTATLAETRSSTWTADTLGDIADEVVTEIDGQKVVAYPALVVTADGLHVQAMPTSADAERMMLTSTLSMLLHETAINDKQMLNGLPLQQRVAVDHYPHGGAAGLVADAKTAAVRDLMMEAGGPVRTPVDFQKLKAHVQAQAPARVRQQVVAVAPPLVEYLAVAQDLEKWRGEAIDDMKHQLEFLLPPHALSTQGLSRLQHLPRYLKAMRIRLDAMDRNPDRDADLQDEIASVQEYLDKRLSRLPASATKTKEVKDIQWMIQELRVGLFAQQLGTPRPVSARRIMKLIDKLG